MKKLVFIILNFLLWIEGLSAQTTYTLTQCIETAYANNLQVKQRGLQMQAAETDYKQAKNNKLPTVNGNFNLGINNGRSIDPFTNGYITEQLASSNTAIGANYVVYNGGRFQNVVKQNAFLLQANKADIEQEKNTLALNIMLAYLQVLNNEDLLKLANTQVEVTKKQVERLDILNKNGAIAPALLYDMKGQLATDELGVINGANALESAKLTLLQWMNVPYNKDIRLEKIGEEAPSVLSPYNAPADDVYKEALKHLAIIKAAELRQQSANIAVKVVQSSYYPTVSLSAQLGTNTSSAARLLTASGVSDVPTNSYVKLNGTNYTVVNKETNYDRNKINYFNQLGNNLNSYVGVNVQVPIFDAFSTKSRMSLAKIQEQTAAVSKDNIKQQLYQAIEQAHLNMQATYNRYSVVYQQVSAYQMSFNVADKRFTEGVIHSVDYLIVKNNLDRAKANLVNTYYDYLLRIKVLDFYRGK
jgi:outer membrane protein